MTLDFVPYYDYFIRMLIAALLGGLIGLERDIHGRAAGLRTHLLVGLGSAVFTILSEIISKNFVTPGFGADPGRIAAQIVSGIGFLGAGVIIKEGVNVRGLTTAACLWGVAAIGMASGGGYVELAIFTTGIALASLIFLKFFERFYSKDTYRVLSIQTSIDVNASQLIDLVKNKHIQVLNCDIEKNYQTQTALTKLSVLLRYRGVPDKLAHGVIKTLEDSALQVNEIKWERL